MNNFMYKTILFLFTITIIIVYCAGDYIKYKFFLDVKYPGIIIKDKNLPGIPTDNKQRYVNIIYNWTNNASLLQSKLTKNDIEKLLDEPTPFFLLNEYCRLKECSIWKTARNIVALETMQTSINDWNKNYYEKISYSNHSKYLCLKAYERAVKINKSYNDYLLDTSLNPFVMFNIDTTKPIDTYRTLKVNNLIENMFFEGNEHLSYMDMSIIMINNALIDFIKSNSTGIEEDFLLGGIKINELIITDSIIKGYNLVILPTMAVKVFFDILMKYIENSILSKHFLMAYFLLNYDEKYYNNIIGDGINTVEAFRYKDIDSHPGKEIVDYIFTDFPFWLEAQPHDKINENIINCYGMAEDFKMIANLKLDNLKRQLILCIDELNQNINYDITDS